MNMSPVVAATEVGGALDAEDMGNGADVSDPGAGYISRADPAPAPRTKVLRQIELSALAIINERLGTDLPHSAFPGAWPDVELEGFLEQMRQQFPRSAHLLRRDRLCDVAARWRQANKQRLSAAQEASGTTGRSRRQRGGRRGASPGAVHHHAEGAGLGAEGQGLLRAAPGAGGAGHRAPLGNGAAGLNGGAWVDRVAGGGGTHQEQQEQATAAALSLAAELEARLGRMAGDPAAGAALTQGFAADEQQRVALESLYRAAAQVSAEALAAMCGQQALYSPLHTAEERAQRIMDGACKAAPGAPWAQERAAEVAAAAGMAHQPAVSAAPPAPGLHSAHIQLHDTVSDLHGVLHDNGHMGAPRKRPLEDAVGGSGAGAAKRRLPWAAQIQHLEGLVCELQESAQELLGGGSALTPRVALAALLPGQDPVIVAPRWDAFCHPENVARLQAIAGHGHLNGQPQPITAEPILVAHPHPPR